MDRMRCNICDNYLRGLEQCKFCSFEWATEPPWMDDDWDILDMNPEEEWEHLQIQYRLKAKGIECLTADIWWDENLAIVIGAKATPNRVAEALGVDEDVIYDDSERGWMILNLFQEKALRLGCDINERWETESG